MGNWGDNIDEELQREEKIEFGFLFSFKTMCNYISRIDEETRQWDDKHPKNLLLRLWANTMVIFQALFLCCYGGFALAIVVFFFFYLYVLIQLSKCWKRFKYSVPMFWLMTGGALAVEFAISRLVQDYVFKVV